MNKKKNDEKIINYKKDKEKGKADSEIILVSPIYNFDMKNFKKESNSQ